MRRCGVRGIGLYGLRGIVRAVHTQVGASDGTRVGEVQLADRRMLAYAEWGPLDGRPLLHFHGIPDGRLNWGAGSAISPRLQLAYIEATSSGGGRGLAEDMRVVLAPWGFDPAEIAAPVFVFHGRRDAIAPPTHAEYWIQTLPNAHPVWFEDAGHFLIERHAEEILDRVAAQ